MTAYPTWLPGVAYLHAKWHFYYGKDYAIGDTPQVASWDTGTWWWPWELQDTVDAPTVTDWVFNVIGEGQFQFTGPTPQTLTATDRWLHALGFDAEPGEVLPASDDHRSRCPSPLCVPLQSCEPERVDIESERALKLGRVQRGHGRIYGGAEVWRFHLVLDPPALRALRVGYATTGRVCVSPWDAAEHYNGDAVPWDPPPTPDGLKGYIEGQVIGLEEGGSWIDPTVRNFYRCSLLIATALPEAT